MSISLSTQSLENKPPSHSESSALRNVMDLSSKTFKIYDERLAHLIARISDDADVVMERHLRLIIDDVLKTLKEIKENIQKDPLDIQEESTLPVVVKELADALSEYILILPHRVPLSHYEAQSKAIEQIYSQAGTWLKQILERMLTNDQEGLSIRVQTLSSVFERGTRLHEVQKSIRDSLKENKT